MASLTKSKNSKYWLACYRDLKGKQKLKSTKIEHTPPATDARGRSHVTMQNRHLAQEIANRLEEVEKGNGSEAHLRKLVSDIGERLNTRKIDFPSTATHFREWLEGKLIAPNTRVRYEQPMKNFLASLGARADLPITEITPRDIDEFINARLKVASASTVSVDLKAVGAPFTLALRRGLIPFNPVMRATPFEVHKEQKEPFTRPEVEALLEATEGSEWHTAILFAAYGGLRLGDSVGRNFKEVNLFEGTLHFRPQKTARKKRDLILPLHPRLKTHLMSLGKQSGAITPELSKMKGGGKSGLSMSFGRIMATVDIDSRGIENTARIFSRKSFHSLRHFFISELQRRGVAPDLRMKLAGHTSELVHARYSHCDIETLTSAISNL
jgi:integrase